MVSWGTAPPSRLLLAIRTSCPGRSWIGSGPKLTTQTNPSPRANASTDSVDDSHSIVAESPHG